MAAREISVKKYVVRLNAEERQQLEAADPQGQRAGATSAEKNILQPHRRQCWVIPPKANGAFVAAMEDVLAVYTRTHDPDRPLVCLDETSKQLRAISKRLRACLRSFCCSATANVTTTARHIFSSSILQEKCASQTSHSSFHRRGGLASVLAGVQRLETAFN